MKREVTAEGILIGFFCILGMIFIDSYFRIIYLVLLILFFIVLFILFLSWYIPKRINDFIKDLDSKILNHYEKSFYEEKDFSDILETTEKLQKMLAKLKFLKFIPYFGHSKKFSYVLEGYAHYIESTIFGTLLNLKKELSEKMAERSVMLSSTKSELKETSNGSQVLSNISELHSIRLERQISQFEALQKILIKI